MRARYFLADDRQVRSKTSLIGSTLIAAIVVPELLMDYEDGNLLVRSVLILVTGAAVWGILKLFRHYLSIARK